jgi:sugar phosphate isomerase/epimerase
MVTSSVSDPRDECTEAVLKTAAGLGIRYYRMGYCRYDQDRDIITQLKELKPAFRDLAALSQQYGIAATYQNHAGDRYVGSALWDLHYLIHELDPRWMGAQYDIRHAAAEGGTTWTLALRLLSSLINTMAIKDFVWTKTDDQWKLSNVPLGEGMVDFPKFLSMFRLLNIDVPVSLHLEYPIAGADKGGRQLSGDKSIVLNAMRKDLEFVRNLFASR